MPKNIYTIYCITNTINGKQYIGQTNNFKRRITEHNQNVKNSKCVIYKAMRKYGVENFIFEPRCSILDKKDLNFYEIQFITEYDTFNNGYNSTTGGNTPIHSAESLQRRSEKMKGQNAGKNNAMYGKIGELHPRHGIHHTEKTKQKMRKPHPSAQGKNNHNWNKSPSKEIRQKIRETLSTGLYVTPLGTFFSSQEATTVYTLSSTSIYNYCKKCNRKITKQAIVESPYLTKSMLDKTYKEIGFWFEPV